MDCPVAHADCFAAALAQLYNGIVITGDSKFKKIEAEFNVHIEWIAKQ
jgi:predicted nucleic acid-binding protein